MRSFVLLSAATLLPGLATAQGPTSEGGYEVTRSQTVANAPAGYVGRKTTDRETRVGKTPETNGNSSTFVMTLGGFVRECPSAEGLVAGTFEYSLTVDDVNRGTGRTHNGVSLNARLEGHVRDDGLVDYVTIDADFNRQREGSPAVQQHIQRRFNVGAQGQPDLAAMEDAVTATADLSIAYVMWMGSTLYTQAQTNWNKINTCAEFAFEPPTRTVTVGPNQATDVRVTLRTKDEKAPIANAEFQANVLDGAGTLTPRSGRTEPSAMSFTYTASASPKNAHGFDIASRSRAGFAGAEWHIVAAAPFEGTFTQTRTMNMSGASLPAEARALGAERYGIGVATKYEINGRLRFEVEAGSTRPSSFGEAGSTFYVATGGEITVSIHGDGRSAAGVCTYDDEHTFRLAELPREASQYLVLEIAGDGRYKLWLAMVSYYLQFKVQDKCRFRTGQRTQQTLDINDAALVLTQQEGVVTNDAIAGQTAEPIIIGVDRYEGRWEFRKAEAPQQP